MFFPVSPVLHSLRVSFSLSPHSTDIQSRKSLKNRPCHVLNIETYDSHSSATIGAEKTLELVQRLYKSEDWEDDMEDILDEFETKYDSPGVLWSTAFLIAAAVFTSI